MSKSAPARSVRLLTPAEVGACLRSSDDHAYRLIATGQLPAVDISLPGSKRPKTRVREDDLAAYIERQTRKAPAMLPDRPPGRRTGPKVATPQARLKVENPDDTDTAIMPPADDVVAQLKRRREASLRLPPLACGHRDPLDCHRSAS
jgi:hypothetical protein